LDEEQTMSANRGSRVSNGPGTAMTKWPRLRDVAGSCWTATRFTASLPSTKEMSRSSWRRRKHILGQSQKGRSGDARTLIAISRDLQPRPDPKHRPCRRRQSPDCTGGLGSLAAWRRRPDSPSEGCRRTLGGSGEERPENLLPRRVGTG